MSERIGALRVSRDRAHSGISAISGISSGSTGGTSRLSKRTAMMVNSRYTDDDLDALLRSAQKRTTDLVGSHDNLRRQLCASVDRSRGRSDSATMLNPHWRQEYTENVIAKVRSRSLSRADRAVFSSPDGDTGSSSPPNGSVVAGRGDRAFIETSGHYQDVQGGCGEAAFDRGVI